MADRDSDLEQDEILRQLAEAVVRQRTSGLLDLVDDPRRLLQELEVYQVELEMQNEALRQAQEELRRTGDRYADLYDFAPVGYYVLNLKGQILAANLTGATQLGVERGRLAGQPFTRFIAPADQDIFYLHRRRLLQGKTPETCELRLKRADGALFYAHLDTVLIEDQAQGGQPVQMRIAASDIQDRKQVEQALAASAEISRRLAAILDWDELLQATVTLVRQEFGYDLVSLQLIDPTDGALACRASAGAANPPGRLPPDEGVAWAAVRQAKVVVVNDVNQAPEYASFFFPGLRSILAAPLAAGGSVGGALLAGSRRPQAFAGRDVAALGAMSAHVATALENARLVARLKQAQARLVESERLAALGQMAATVAHELRNPVMGLRMGVEYFTRELPADDPRWRGASLMVSNIERLNRIVEDILFIGRVPQPHLQPTLLQQVLEQELARWEPLLAAQRIQVQRRLAQLPPLNVDSHQLGRAVSNLISNSLDSLPPGGELALSLHAEGDEQVITVTDNGPGIPAEVLPHIFESFFTTKTRGTGLGLAIVKQVVEQHGGRVVVSSEPGASTHFTITLPG